VTKKQMEEIVKEQMAKLSMQEPDFQLFSVQPWADGQWWIDIQDLRAQPGLQSRRFILMTGPNMEKTAPEWLEKAFRKLKDLT